MKVLHVLIVVIVVAELAICEETTSNPRRGSGIRSRTGDRDRRRQNESSRIGKRIGEAAETKNKTGLLALGDGELVNLVDKDKYKEEYEDAEYEYEDEPEGDDKFVETGTGGIILDHVDFVLLRLKHISMRTTSNITELLALQKKEFEVNTDYKLGWSTAEKLFNSTKRDIIFNNTSEDSIVRQVPVEYHIAIIAYTLGEPSMYYVFNKDTREVCSGTDIDKYQWKSYFKLLQLAVETLGSREKRWKDDYRFLYRGASGSYDLKEGQVLAFQHFISTSEALISAENFAGKTLFEFQGFYNGTAMAIWDHSYYEHEREVLFSPVQVFRIDSIHVGSHYTRYVLVKHEVKQPCNQQNTSPENNLERNELNSNWLRAYSSSSASNLYENSFLIMSFFFSAILLNTTH